MLLVHGHAPAAAAHLHADAVVASTDSPDTAAGDAAVASVESPSVFDRAPGAGSWATRGSEGPDFAVGLLELAVVALLGLVTVRGVDIRAWRTRRLGQACAPGSTPVLRHEVIRV